jgi:predicted metallo-beta-lactamase superfamily hydrolase
VAAVGRGDSHIKAMTQHLLRDRTYSQLQEDVEKGLRKKGIKISWTPELVTSPRR